MTIMIQVDNGKYFIDDWDNVFNYQLSMPVDMVKGFERRWRTEIDNLHRLGKMDDMTWIGVNDWIEDDIFNRQARWVKNGHYRFVGDWPPQR